MGTLYWLYLFLLENVKAGLHKLFILPICASCIGVGLSKGLPRTRGCREVTRGQLNVLAYAMRKKNRGWPYSKISESYQLSRIRVDCCKSGGYFHPLCKISRIIYTVFFIWTMQIRCRDTRYYILYIYIYMHVCL